MKAALTIGAPLVALGAVIHQQESRRRCAEYAAQIENAREAVRTSGAAHLLENDVAKRYLSFATAKPLSTCVKTVEAKDWTPSKHGEASPKATFPALPSKLPWWVWGRTKCELEAFDELQHALGLSTRVPSTRDVYAALPNLLRDPLVKEYLADCEAWHDAKTSRETVAALFRKYRVDTYHNTPTLYSGNSSEILWLDPCVVWTDNLSF